MSPIIEFRFEGAISPKTVSLKELGDLLVNLENFFIPLMLKENPSLKRNEIKISLVEIREGSYNLGLDSSQREELIKAYIFASVTIENQKWKNLPVPSLKAMKDIITFAQKYDCETKIVPQEKELSAVVLPKNLTFTSFQIKEVRSLCCKIIRVGGKTPSAQVEVPGFQGLVPVELENENLAKQLAGRLYEFVRLEGELWWDFDEHKIVRFKAWNFEPFEPFKRAETLQKLSKEVASYLKHIKDVVRYIDELRREE